MDSSGLLGALEQVWLNKGGVATIIPLKQLKKFCPVTYDSTCNGGTFVCCTKDGNVVLRNNDKGMPYLDLRESKAKAVLSFAPEAAQSFVQIVQGNMEGFTRRKVEEAQKARKAQAMLGHPTDRNFLGMVCGGMIPNCPVTANAVTKAHQIFGPDLAGVRGRTVRRPLESVTTNYVQIPRAILEQHQLVTLAVDIMFGNGVPFLVSVARGLNLVTAEFIPSRTAKQLAAGIIRMMDLYAWGGFQVGRVLMDSKFEKLRNLVPILAINTTAAKEHLPEVERKISLIKERGRGILNTLPFKIMPRLMLIELIYHVVLWLNAFLAKSGVSETLSPHKIVYRHKLDFAKHCRLPFGTYCEIHNEPTPTNSMLTCSTPALVLSSTGNLQGTYKFFSLAMGKKVKQRAFTPYPMLDLVIRKVKVYGKSTALPGSFDFANRNSIFFEWNEEVNGFPEGIIEIEDVVLYPSLSTEHPGVVLMQDQPLPSIEEELVPQGCAKDTVARNANLESFNIAGVVAAPLIVPANADKLSNYEIDDNDSIIAVGDIPQQPPHAPLVVNNTDNNGVAGSDNNNEDAESNKDNGSNDDNDNNLLGNDGNNKPVDLVAATNANNN